MGLKDTQLVSENKNWLEKKSCSHPEQCQNKDTVTEFGVEKRRKELADVSGAKTPILQYGVPRDIVDKQVIKM